MKKSVLFMALACCCFACSNIQAQEKKKHGFLKFMEKVDKTLDKTNQVLEDTNNALSGKVQNVTQNGSTKVLSSTKNLKVEFKDSYVEGYDVVVNLIFTNTTNKEFGLNWGEGTAWDNNGDSYSFDYSRFFIGGDDVGPTGVIIPEGIPVKGVIRLKDAARSNATEITKLKFDTYQYKNFEVRNIPIIREDNTSNSTSGEVENQTTENAQSVKILSPTRSLKLQYKNCYAENENTVFIDFMITNLSGEDLELNSGEGTAWDDQGESHGIKAVIIGGDEVNSLGVTLPADIPLKGKIVLKGVDKSVKEIKLVKFHTYQFKGFEIRNLIINREGIQ